MGNLRGQMSTVLIVLLLTATGLMSGPRRPSPAPASSKPTDAGKLDAGVAAPAGMSFPGEDDVLRPLADFLGLNSTDAAAVRNGLKLKNYRTRTLIVLVPDPADSRFRYQFDMQHEAVQRAIEASGFVLERSYFPWPRSTPRDAKPDQATKAEAGKDGKPSVPPHRRLPGVILFRGPHAPNGGSQELLVMLLVGETPTWGVQREAMLNALTIANNLAIGEDSGRTSEPIRILGPTFSGSGDSLAAALSSWDGRSGREIWVCTGSATSLDRGAFLKNCECAKKPQGVVRLSATVIPDRLVLNHLLRYLKDPERDLSRGAAHLENVALLTESNTVYGAENAEEETGIIRIPFPMHISQVRNAQDRSDTQGKDKDAAGKAASSSLTRIPFSLDEEGTPSDSIPVYFPPMTTPTVNLIVSNILTTLARERVRHVGIIATDTRDIIFLTKLIREYAPDVRIFLMGSDLRLTHPEFSHDFRGAIVASSYPLDSRAQAWTYPSRGGRQRLLFAHDVDVGCYNAALVLLGGQGDGANGLKLVEVPERLPRKADADVPNRYVKELISYGRPFELFDGMKKGSKGDAWIEPVTRPPVWINLVGQHDIWPLRAVPVRPGAEDSDLYQQGVAAVVRLEPVLPATAGRPADLMPKYPFIWRWTVTVSCLLALLTCAGHVYAVAWRAGRLRGPTAPESSVLTFLDIFRVKNLRWRARAYCWAAVCLGAFLAPLSYAAGALPGVFAIGLPEIDDWLPPLLLWLTLAVLAGLLGFNLVLAQRNLVRAPAEDRANIQVWYFSAAAATLVALAFLATFALKGAFGPLDADRMLASRRQVSLSSGLSPIVPALFLGLACFAWGITQLKRGHLLAVYLHDNPLDGRGRGGVVPDAEGLGVQAVNDRCRRVFRVMRHPFKERWFGLCVAIGVTMTVLALFGVFGRYIATPEGWLFDSLFQIAFGVLATILLVMFLRLAFLWKHLRVLFHGLSLLPMAGAFDRLSSKVAMTFGRFLQAPMPSDADRIIPGQQYRLLRRAYSPDVDRYLEQDLGCSVADRTGIATAMTAPAGDEGQTPSRGFLKDAGLALLPALARWWKRRPMEGAFGKSLTGEPARETAPPAPNCPWADPPPSHAGDDWLRMAEDFLAIEIVQFVGQFAAHVRILSGFLLIGPFLLLFAATWYPFQPQHLLSTFLWTFILAAAGLAIWIAVEIDRDEFVSRVSKTRASAVTFDRTFVTTVMTYLLPVLGLLVAQFPDIAYWLNSLFEPLGRVVR